MVNLKKIVAPKDIETNYTLHTVNERFYTVAHDFPCLGARDDVLTSDKIKGVFNTPEKAKVFRDKLWNKREFLNQVQDEKLDKFDKARILYKKFKWEKSGHYSDWIYDFEVESIKVSNKDVQIKNDRMYYKRHRVK